MESSQYLDALGPVVMGAADAPPAPCPDDDVAAAAESIVCACVYDVCLIPELRPRLAIGVWPLSQIVLVSIFF
jgi:hypothetical protein